MLVLSRKTGQSIRIGDDIVLTLVSVNGKRAKIGIEAPAHCNIVRQEILVDSSRPWVDEVSAELHLTHS
ncbi:MAG TPA: carbon storage regulator [Planctomycetaceae bacterium]|nr:carbon storage regulator [Planctomycetaceae bacterium]